MQPISTQSRIQLLDILRGFAIFGMFAVNMTIDLPFGDGYWGQKFDGIDRLTLILVNLTSNGRFITIFSLLFGMGFCIQLQRARASGTRFAPLYVRRLLGLFLIAGVTIALGLDTHILIDYATYGVLLLFFYKRTPRFILVVTIMALLTAKIPVAVESYQVIRSEARMAQQSEADNPNGELPAIQDPDETQRERTYLEGSYAEIVADRLGNLSRYLTSVDHYITDIDILGLLLLGLFVGRIGLIYDESERKKFARQVLPWLLWVGSIAVLGFVYIEYFLSTAWDQLPLSTVKWALGWPTGMVVLGLGYAAGIALLVERPAWNRILSPFAAVGRLALTNYLLTTVVLAVVIYGWGFGLMNRLRPFTGLSIVLLTFPLQLLISNWWVRRFRFGPSEWIWRAMTYGSLPPFRKLN